LRASVVASDRGPHFPPQGSYLTPDDREGRAALVGLSDDGIFLLLFRSGAAFKERWIQMTVNRWENKHKIPPEEKEKVKGKSKREK
jgi:hypothetical protein